MVKRLKDFYMMFYFIISLSFMEAVLRMSTTGGFIGIGLLYSFLFSVPFAIVIYIICTLFRNRVCIRLFKIIIGVLSVVFCSQIIYFKIFRTFYTLYSAANGEQVLGFWNVALEKVIKNLGWVLLIFLPYIFMMAFWKMMLPIEKANIRSAVCLMLCALIFHLVGVWSVNLSSREQYSPYDLYYRTPYSILSVKELGLLTTSRLDFQRLATGWSPTGGSSAISDGESRPIRSPSVTPGESNSVPAGEQETEYNAMDIDFDSLISSEKDSMIKQMDRYFKSVEPTAKNEYTGKYSGYNLIFITAESFSPYAVNKDATPTLYKMVHKGYYFPNFYNPIWGVSTSDGEYVACTGLIPKSGVWSFKKSGSNYLPFVMGNQLRSLGYKTMAYHDHTYTYYGRNISHPNMGYTYKGLGSGLTVKKTWPESDLEMMEKTIPEYIGSTPFHTYYMTVSGHLRYSFSGNAMAAKNKELVKDLPYMDQGKAYIAAQIELDKSMEYLLSRLQQAGIADRTLIALSPDHYPYGLDDQALDDLASHHVEKNFELYKSTFILYTEGMIPQQIDKYCSSLDIIPTLSNLLGLKYDSRLLMGRDIFSDSEPLVIFQNRSFITDRGSYNAEEKKFTPSAGGAPVDKNYINGISKMISDKFYYSAKILDTDYYRRILRK